MQVNKQQLTLDMEQQTGSKLGNECHPGKINNLRYADDTTLTAESKEIKSLLMKVKEKSKNLA